MLGLPIHTGSPIAQDPSGNIVSTPIPDETGPTIVEAKRPESYTTPDGNKVRAHGGKGGGKEYMLGKGHTPESLDEILSNPASKMPSSRGDTSTGGRQSATVIFGRNGDWVVVNDLTGQIISMNDRWNSNEEPPE